MSADKTMKPMTEEQKALLAVAMDEERTNDFYRGVAMTMYEYRVNRIKVVVAFVLGVPVGFLISRLF